MLTQETDLIRNGVLQEMLALRRQLEVACQQHRETEVFSCDLQLTGLKRLYASLEAMCDRLESPFVQDSLPLALQHSWQRWQEPIVLHLNLPLDWTPEPIELTRLLLLLIDQLFQQLATISASLQGGQLSLNSQDGLKRLHLQIAFADELPLAHVHDLRSNLIPFMKTFHLFTQGQYALEQDVQALTLTLHWAISAE
jgi:hypothetical protein